MKLTFGVHKNGELIHVSKAGRGLSCECLCPTCNNPLVAKKGKIKEHHFAHHNTVECNPESALHKIAKHIIEESGEILIPDIEISFNLGDFFYNPYLLNRQSKSNRPYTGESIRISKGELIKLDRFKQEEHLGDIRPDIVGYLKNRPILFEIYVTHRSDEKKISKLKENNLSAIEIDLSALDHQTELEELRSLVLYEKSNRYWLNNNKANITKERLLAEADTKIIVERGNALHVNDCPKRKRILYDGKTFANVLGDCGYCELAYEINDDYVRCGAKHIEYWEIVRAHITGQD